MAARHLAAEQRGLGGFHREDFRLAITLFDRSTDARQGATRPVTRGERVNRAGHLLQDFLTGRMQVIFRV